MTRMTVSDAVYWQSHERRPMKTLRQWTEELMDRQFLDGLIVGFLAGALIVTCTALWWAQDRSIVRAAKAASPYEVSVPDVKNEFAGIAVEFKGVASPAPWPPNPIIEAIVVNPKWTGSAKPGDIRMLCAFYEENRMIVNPCPDSWMSVTTGPSLTHGPYMMPAYGTDRAPLVKKGAP